MTKLNLKKLILKIVLDIFSKEAVMQTSPLWHFSVTGGIWGNNGIVTGEYGPGEWIDVSIEVTTQHLGYFIFKVCPSNNFEQDPDQDCFDRFKTGFVMIQNISKVSGQSDKMWHSRRGGGSTKCHVNFISQLNLDFKAFGSKTKCFSARLFF